MAYLRFTADKSDYKGYSTPAHRSKNNTVYLLYLTHYGDNYLSDINNQPGKPMSKNNNCMKTFHHTIICSHYKCWKTYHQGHWVPCCYSSFISVVLFYRTKVLGLPTLLRHRHLHLRPTGQASLKSLSPPLRQ